MLKFITVLFFTTISVIPVFAASSVSLSQSRIIAKVNATESIYVSNGSVGWAAVHIFAAVEDNPDTVKTLPKGFKGCETAIDIKPKNFEIEPNAQQKVKITAREDGFCRIYFVINKLENKSDIETPSIIDRQANPDQSHAIDPNSVVKNDITRVEISPGVILPLSVQPIIGISASIHK